MTLIARCTFNGVPMYFCDLLLSSEKKALPADVTIPASNKINAILPDDTPRQVSGLVQKLNKLSDRLIVAWAGSYIQARAMIRDLKELDAENETLSEHDFLNLMRNVPEKDRNDLCIIGSYCTTDVVQEGDIVVKGFSYNAQKYTEEGTEIFIGGSGERSFMETLPQLINKNTIPQNIDGGLFEWVEQTGYALLAFFVGEEMLTGRNILEWWGGGFELATLRDQTFLKIGDTLFLFFRALKVPQKDEIAIRLIPKFLKYDYIDDVLAVQKLEITMQPKDDTPPIEHSFQLMTPILKSKSEIKELKIKELPDFSHTTLCCITYYEDGKDINFSTRLLHDTERECQFKVNKTNNKVEISFSDTLKNYIENDIRDNTGISATFSQVGD